MPIRNRDRIAATLSAVVFACLIGTSVCAQAQGSQKPASEKWRPRDGLYIEAGTTLTGPCEGTAPFLFELSKKRFVVDERSGCKVMKITDTAPGAVRLDMTCNESETAGDDDGKDYKEIMTLRQIDDGSFFMHLTDKGKFMRPEFQVNFCPATPAGKWPSTFEIQRDAVQKQLKAAEWHPHDGVYVKPGTDSNDRCSKSGDAVIELGQIAISSGTSHCEVADIEASTQASIRLDARCDLKPGQTGTVARPIGGRIVFAPVGSEKIIITDSGNQTISIQKSRNGEFSEPPELFTYCPEATQRAYVDSKTAK